MHPFFLFLFSCHISIVFVQCVRKDNQSVANYETTVYRPHKPNNFTLCVSECAIDPSCVGLVVTSNIVGYADSACQSVRGVPTFKSDFNWNYISKECFFSPAPKPLPNVPVAKPRIGENPPQKTSPIRRETISSAPLPNLIPTYNSNSLRFLFFTYTCIIM